MSQLIMSMDVSSQTQTFFQPIHSEQEMRDILQSLVNARQIIHVKVEDARDVYPLTTLLPLEAANLTLLCKFENGQSLHPCKLTILFEINAFKFFASGQLYDVQGMEYSLRVEKLFKLQRRNSFRVDLPEKIISARFKVTLINKTNVALNFRVINLSADGMAIEVPADSMRLLDRNSGISGLLTVGAHDPIELQARVRYGKKHTLVDGTQVYNTGCHFGSNTAATSQKLAFIVNDCHRLIFSRMHK